MYQPTWPYIRYPNLQWPPNKLPSHIGRTTSIHRMGHYLPNPHTHIKRRSCFQAVGNSNLRTNNTTDQRMARVGHASLLISYRPLIASTFVESADRNQIYFSDLQLPVHMVNAEKISLPSCIYIYIYIYINISMFNMLVLHSTRNVHLTDLWLTITNQINHIYTIFFSSPYYFTHYIFDICNYVVLTLKN